MSSTKGQNKIPLLWPHAQHGISSCRLKPYFGETMRLGWLDVGSLNVEISPHVLPRNPDRESEHNLVWREAKK